MDETKRQKLYKQIIEKLEILRVDDEFIVENLLPPRVWEKLTDGERRALGRMFKNKVETKEIDNVELLNSKGKNKYRKTKK